MTNLKVGHKRGLLNAARSHRLVFELACTFYEQMDTPYSLRCYLMLVNGEHEELVRAPFPFSRYGYSDVDLFQKDYACWNLLRKYPSLSTGIDTKRAALDSFEASESVCRETNKRFRHISKYRVSKNPTTVERVIRLAQEKIERLTLGLDLNSVFELMAWGPGNASNLHGDDTSSFKKFEVTPECTESCAPYVRAAIMASPSWFEHLWLNACDVTDLGSLNFIRGNCVTTVPKDAKTDRPIAIEPHCNMYIQRGFGRWIRARLKHVGVDLDFGQARNGLLARRGARDGSLATVDLSSASDTISQEVVRFLLPDDLYSHLESTRSKFFRLPGGDWRRYEKFSSMGNGFTFELESLIFWALAASCLELHRLSTSSLCIYGDDIVIDVTAYNLLSEVLTFCGFKVNASKSFASGPFRESCGEHYFNSIDVKPVYVDKTISTVIDAYALHNQLYMLACRLGGADFPASVLRPCLSKIVSFVRPGDRLYCPVSASDGAFWGTFEQCSPFRSRGKGRETHEGFSFLVLGYRSLERHASGSAVLPWLLYNLSRKGSSPTTSFGFTSQASKSATSNTYLVRVRDRTIRPSRVWVAIPRYVGVWL